VDWIDLTEEYRQRVFDKRVMRKILSIRGTTYQGTGGDCIIRRFMSLRFTRR